MTVTPDASVIPEIVRQLAAKTAFVLGEHGWAQGTYVSRTGALCLSAAVRVAASGGLRDIMPAEMREPVMQLRSLLMAKINLVSFAESIPEWNDNVARSVDDCINLLQDVMRP